jgi:hypothetical protein
VHSNQAPEQPQPEHPIQQSPVATLFSNRCTLCIDGTWFTLTELTEVNCVRVECQPGAVDKLQLVDKLEALINECIDESMPRLQCFAVVPARNQKAVGNLATAQVQLTNLRKLQFAMWSLRTSDSVVFGPGQVSSEELFASFRPWFSVGLEHGQLMGLTSLGLAL